MSLTPEARLRAALAAAPEGWTLASAWQEPHHAEDGTAAIGSIDEDGNKSEVLLIDTGNYFQPEAALPLAEFYAAANTTAIAAVLAELDSLRATRQPTTPP